MVARVHLDHHIRSGEALLHIALAQENIRTADRIGRKHVVLGDLRVQDRRAGLHRLERIEHERQLLPLDLDQPQRLLRDLLGLRRDRDPQLVAGPGAHSRPAPGDRGICSTSSSRS